jgi:transcriptional/translational regulatory protein YebC/TACO1
VPNQFPKDTIERAIKKGTGQLDDGKIIEEVHVRGVWTPSSRVSLVECQTDNRARTAPDIRYIFKKHQGQMGEQGSVAWMFERIGLGGGRGLRKVKNLIPEEEAIEAGANEVEKVDETMKPSCFLFLHRPRRSWTMSKKF